MTLDAKSMLHFRDERPPHEIKWALERELRILFKATMEGDRLCMRAKATVVGAAYEFSLRFDAALQSCNCYSLTMDVSWPAQSASHADYYRNNSVSWFAHWTRGFSEASPPLAGEGSTQRYRELCEEYCGAELGLDSIDSIQQAIIEAMKRGASFRTSHKEGGTNICWTGERFVRSDYGEYPDEKQFVDEPEFLGMLLQFCHSDVNQVCCQEQGSEVDTWRLIMRRMHLP